MGHMDDETIVAYLFHDWISDAQAGKVAESVRSLVTPTPDCVYDDGLEPLTQRELQALRLVALSLEIPYIADSLGISSHTVLAHIRNARENLKARNRMDAVLIAQRRGLL